jgi:hypothetical protein
LINSATVLADVSWGLSLITTFMIFICGGLVTKWQAEVFALPKKTKQFGLFYEVYAFGNPVTAND